MPDYKMKNSGIEWIGEIPQHWNIRRIKDLITLKSGNGITSLEINKNGKYPVYGGNGIRGYIDTYTHSGNRLLIGRQGALCGNIHNVSGNFFASEHAVVCTPYFPLNIRWLEELLRIMNLNQYSNAAAQPGLAVDKIKRLKIPFPKKNEREAIANYLNKTCKIINKAISIKQQQLEKLETYQKSVIHEAVTKGLDKKVAMKDSGVKWLGEIPEHWNSSQLKNFGLGTMTNGLFKKKEFFGRGTKLVNVTDLYQPDNIIKPSSLDRVFCTVDEIIRYRVAVGDIFFVRSSLKMEGIAISAVVEKLDEATVFECHIIRFNPNRDRSNPKFINYQINSTCIHNRLVSLSKTVTMTTISQNKIASIKLAKPPLKEQTIIANYLDNICKKINNSKIIIEQQIEKLTQYRQSLIHECVTGKKRIYQGKIN